MAFTQIGTPIIKALGQYALDFSESITAQTGDVIILFVNWRKGGGIVFNPTPAWNGQNLIQLGSNFDQGEAITALYYVQALASATANLTGVFSDYVVASNIAINVQRPSSAGVVTPVMPTGPQLYNAGAFSAPSLAVTGVPAGAVVMSFLAATAWDVDYTHVPEVTWAADSPATLIGSALNNPDSAAVANLYHSTASTSGTVTMAWTPSATTPMWSQTAFYLPLPAGGSTATPPGVATSTSVGSATATGSAIASPSGVATATGVGTATANGGGLLRSVSLQNHVLSASESRGKTGVLLRHPITIGSANALSIVGSDLGWVRGTSTTANVANTFTIVDMVIENGTTSAPVTKGGSRTWTVNPGDNDSQYDPFLASALGLSTFTRGVTYWVKIRLLLPSTSAVMPYPNGRNTGQLTGSQVIWYDPAATTPSSTDATGVFTTTGGTPETRQNGYCPIFLGTFENSADPDTWFAAGDNIYQGLFDATNHAGGLGIFQRALYNGGSNVLAGINFTRTGSATNSFNNATSDRCAYWSKYCKYASFHYGSNDFGTTPGTSTATSVLTSARTTWTKFRGYGASKIIALKLTPRTSSSNLFADEANQTAVSSDWDTGGQASIYNTSLDSEVGSNIDAVVAMSSCRGTNPVKWVTNGTSNYATSDGINPLEVLNISLGAEVRAVMNSISATATATPSGVSTSTGVGTAVATGAARVNATGVSVGTGVGTATATGGGSATPATATPAGVSTTTGAGYALPYIGVCSFVTLTSVNTAAGYLGAYITLQVGFKISFQTAASLGLPGGQVNYIDVDGGIYTDFDGTQYLSVFNPANGTTLQVTLINGDVAGVVAVPTGVATSTGVGTAVATGAARATPSGVSTATAVGSATATGGTAGSATATPSGVSTGISVGSAVAIGAARATPSGVSVPTAVGAVTVLAGNYLSDINGGQPVRVGSTGNTLTVNLGFTPTSGTVGGMAVTNIQGTTPNFTFDMPSLVEGQTHLGYGNRTAVFSNGASSPQRAVSFLPKMGQDFVTLAGTIEQTIKGIGYGFSPALAVNDQIEFPSPSVVVGTNAGYPNTKAITGSHLCKHISVSDNKVRFFLLKVGA